MSLRLSPEEYKALCKRVWGRDGWRCRRCGLRDHLHCHHVQFRSQGGPDESWNLLSLCSECHDAVHNYKLFVDVAEGNWIGTGGGCDGEVVFSWSY